LQYRGAALLARLADQSGLIDALPQAGDFRQVVEHPEVAAVVTLSDQTQDCIGADIEKCATPAAHLPTALSKQEISGFAQAGSISLTRVSLIQLSRSTSAR
jgi:hypothetical protein